MPVVDAAVSERQLQDAVVELAGYLGWRWYHTHDSRRSPAGFPDLVLCRERVIFVELKSRRGTLSAEQAMWLEALRDAGAEVHVWKPRDWANGRVEEILRQKLPARVLAPEPTESICGRHSES